jgi:rSAM/selenodomain-associated transferase 2
MISVIIPTFNDEHFIGSTISHIKKNAYIGLLKEIIVVDGGSFDKTVREAEEAGAAVIRSIQRGRAKQMNLGAHYAKGKILYFVLPGSLPPKNFTNEIVRATQKNFWFGTFTLRANSKHWFLNTLTWLAQVRLQTARLDYQTLFVDNYLFKKAGGFREDHLLLEDYEIIRRLKRYSNFIVLKDHIISSTRKYMAHGVLKTEISYLLTHLLYWFGYSQGKLMKVQRFLLSEKPQEARAPEALKPSLNSLA